MLTPKFICDGLSDLEIIRKSLEVVDYFSCLYERYEEKLMRYIKRVAFATDEEAEALEYRDKLMHRILANYPNNTKKC